MEKMKNTFFHKFAREIKSALSKRGMASAEAQDGVVEDEGKKYDRELVTIRLRMEWRNP